MSQQDIQYNLIVNTEMTSSEMKKLEITLVRIMGYIEQLVGDNPSLRKLINMVQATINAVRSLRMALRSLQLASGPIGWAYAATSIIAGGLSAGAIYNSTVGV